MPAVYIDSCVFVTAFETTGSEATSSRRLLEELQSTIGVAMTSELTLAELLAPVRRPQVMSVADRRIVYLELLDDRGFITLAPVTRSVLMDTIKLRETHTQRIPDAIHVATAVQLDCRFFLTFDHDARRIPPPLEWVIPNPENIDRLIETVRA